VLSCFPAEEAERLPVFLEIGAEALECLLREGSGRAMNRYNIDRQWDRREQPQRKKAQKVGVEGEEPETEEKEGSDG